jgi:hypothetical protein
MINFKNKTIDVLSNLNLTGNQIYLMVDQELKNLAEAEESGKLPDGFDGPYEVQTIKIGERTGQEPITVGLSVVLLQRIQLKETWNIVDPSVEVTEPVE